MTNDFDNLLDQIRIELYKQARDMTNAETVKTANVHGNELAVKYGIKVVKGDLTSSAKSANAF